MIVLTVTVVAITIILLACVCCVAASLGASSWDSKEEETPENLHSPILRRHGGLSLSLSYTRCYFHFDSHRTSPVRERERENGKVWVDLLPHRHIPIKRLQKREGTRLYPRNAGDPWSVSRSLLSPLFWTKKRVSIHGLFCFVLAHEMLMKWEEKLLIDW